MRPALRWSIVAVLVVAAVVLAFFGWRSGQPSSPPAQQGAGRQAPQSEDRGYTLAVIGEDGQYLLSPMAIDERPLSKDENKQVNLHMDSSLPAFFIDNGSTVMPTEIGKRPVVLVAHMAAAGVDVGYGPFTFMEKLQEGPQAGREIVRISGGQLASDVVCRADSVVTGPSAIPDSVYQGENLSNIVIFITCALTPEGKIDKSRSIRLTSTCLGT